MNLWSALVPASSWDSLTPHPADLETGLEWDADLVAFVAGGKAGAAELERKLGKVQKDGGVPAGICGEYFSSRYGLPRSASLSLSFFRWSPNPARLQNA